MGRLQQSWVWKWWNPNLKGGSSAHCLEFSCLSIHRLWHSAEGSKKIIVTTFVKFPMPHWSESKKHCSSGVFRPSVMILPLPLRIQKRTNGPTRGSEHLTTRPARTWTHFPFNILGKLGRTEGGGLLNTNTWMAYIWLTYVRLRACLIFHELCKRVGIHTLITTLRGILFSAAHLGLCYPKKSW